MADEADAAARYDEMAREAGMAQKRQAPRRTGRCLYCNAPAEGLFCDSDCAGDWDLEQRVLRRQGRAT